MRASGEVPRRRHTSRHYLHLTWDERDGRVLRPASLDFQRHTDSTVVPVEGDAPLHLRAGNKGCNRPLHLAPRRVEWNQIGSPLDASPLSDEHATRLVDGRITDWGYTGSVFALVAQDLTGAGLTADFDFFDYREL